jgi:deazaflavin-dependent oxidoreductase (nitroreductase family)
MSEAVKRGMEPGYQKPDISLVQEEHVRRYLETDGEVGYLWNNVPILIFTTKGRKSGQPRRNAIIFTKDGDNYVIVASHSGNPKHPQWFLNILADPHVQVQVKGEKFDTIARAAEGEERDRLWAGAARIWPNYDVYTTRTTREIPVVVLQPVGKRAEK